MKAQFWRKEAAPEPEPEEEMSLTRYASAAPPAPDDSAFNALRAGFTAAVSHELRTPPQPRSW